MTGLGRRRRTRLDTRPRRTALVAVLSVAVVGAVPVLVWKGARTIVDSNEGSTVTARAVPAAQIPPTPVGMLVIVGGDGRASSPAPSRSSAAGTRSPPTRSRRCAPVIQTWSST